MNTTSQLEREIARYEMDASYYETRADHCRREATLLRQELQQEQSCKRFTLQDARELATTILSLEGLTGAEVEAAEKVLADDFRIEADIQRLRTIAINHSLFGQWIFA